MDSGPNPTDKRHGTGTGQDFFPVMSGMVQQLAGSQLAGPTAHLLRNSPHSCQQGRSRTLEPQEAHGIHQHQHGGELVIYGRGEWRLVAPAGRCNPGPKPGGDGHPDQIGAQGKPQDVLADHLARLTRQTDEQPQVLQRSPQQHRIPGLGREVHSRTPMADGKARAGPGQRGRVVDPVAHHGNRTATRRPFQFGDQAGLLGWQ